MKIKEMLERFKKPGEKENKNYGPIFHLLRYLSYWMSIPFVYLPFTANQITLIANLVQASSILVIINADGYDKLYGVLLYFVGDMLDFVDGNIARYRNQTSKKGVFYDQIGHVVLGPLFFLAVTLSAYNNTNEIIYMYMSITVAMFVPLMSYQISVSPKYFTTVTEKSSADELIEGSKINKLLFFAKKTIAYFYHFKMEILILAILFNQIELLAYISTIYFIVRFFIQLYLDQRMIK